MKRLADVMGVIFAFMFWFAPHPVVAALNEADEAARLGIVPRADEDAVQEQPDAVAAALAAPVFLRPRAGSAPAPYSVAARPAVLSARTLRLRPGTARPSGVRPTSAFVEEDAPTLHGRSAAAVASAATAATEAEVRGRHTLRGVLLRRYVARHASWIFFGFITVAVAEQRLLDAPPGEPYGRSPTSLFAVLFELLSAYGTNGLSFGYPGVNFNLVGMWTPISKLVIIALLFLGRHRSMPRAVDRPLAAHVRALSGIVRDLRGAARQQRRALEQLRAAAAKVEAEAGAAAHGAPHRGRDADGVGEVHVSLEAALALVRRHEAERSHAAGDDAPAGEDVAV
jgi:hypothetical protein